MASSTQVESDKCYQPNNVVGPRFKGGVDLKHIMKIGRTKS